MPNAVFIINTISFRNSAVTNEGRGGGGETGGPRFSFFIETNGLIDT